MPTGKLRTGNLCICFIYIKLHLDSNHYKARNSVNHPQKPSIKVVSKDKYNMSTGMVSSTSRKNGFTITK